MTLLDRDPLGLDDDLQVEARTVLSKCPEPQDAFEVAAVLETLGYTDATARTLGDGSLFQLASRVYERLDDLGRVPADTPDRAPGEEPPWYEAHHPMLWFTALGLLYSVPWLCAIAALLVTGTSFWSSSALTPVLASGISLALFMALVTSGCFAQAFARRAIFYYRQGKLSLVRWTAWRTLGTGAVVCAALFVGAYFLLERGLGAYTPGTTRSFLALGLAICMLQLVIAPLYVVRAFGWLTVAVGVGTVLLVVFADHELTQPSVDPFAVVKVQLLALVPIGIIAAIGSWWRLWRPDTGPARHDGSPRPPRRWAFVRSVAPYALYGAAYFAILFTDQLVAGGLWDGHFRYERAYQVDAGAALLILVPLFAYIVASSEALMLRVRTTLATLAVTDAPQLRADISAFYRRHVAILATAGLTLAAIAVLVVTEIGPRSGLLSDSGGVGWVFVGAMVSYVALAVGIMNSQLLFALSRPVVPALAAAAGAVLSALLGGGAALAVSRDAGAVIGLAGGTVLFAAITTVKARTVFSSFDASYFRAA